MSACSGRPHRSLESFHRERIAIIMHTCLIKANRAWGGHRSCRSLKAGPIGSGSPARSSMNCWKQDVNGASTREITRLVHSKAAPPFAALRAFEAVGRWEVFVKTRLRSALIRSGQQALENDRGMDRRSAVRAIRRSYWSDACGQPISYESVNLGDGPSGDMVTLMECVGIVVVTISMNTTKLDGLCSWSPSMGACMCFSRPTRCPSLAGRCARRSSREGRIG